MFYGNRKWLLFCVGLCGVLAGGVAVAGPFGGYGAIRYIGGGYWNDSDQAWNAGFGGAPSNPRVDPWKDNRSVATVNPSTVYPSFGSGGGQNRINSPGPVNYGSIQNGDDARTATPISTGSNPSWVLKKMSDYLADQKQLTLWITETVEQAGESGQKIQLTSQQTTYVQRPDKLAVDVTTDTSRTRIVYDGGGATVIDLGKNLYGTIAVQGPLDTALDTLARSYGMAVPADDLLYKGAYARLEGKIRVAQDLGMEKLGGHACIHLAFVGERVDCQIWIQSGNEPMPRKILIIYKDAPGRPRCILEVTRWDLGPIPASTFKADLPEGARQIKILPRR